MQKQRAEEQRQQCEKDGRAKQEADNLGRILDIAPPSTGSELAFNVAEGAALQRCLPLKGVAALGLWVVAKVLSVRDFEMAPQVIPDVQLQWTNLQASRQEDGTFKRGESCGRRFKDLLPTDRHYHAYLKTTVAFLT